MTSVRMGFLLGVAVVVALALGAVAGLGAGSRPRPDLVISAASGPAKSVRIGTRMTVRVTTRNAGRRRAGASTTRLFLARRARRGRGDRGLASVRIVALRVGRSVRRTMRVRVPARALPGRYRLLVCADAARRVSESRESNNCRAVRGALRVLTSSRGPVGPPGPVTNPTGDDDRDGFTNAVDCAPKDPAINPGAADRPDVPGFRDTNCDGIDGNASRGTFVSPTGDDANPGTRAEPKRTLGAAVSMALAQGKDVYVTAGFYAERLDVANGVGVYGGYAADWSRSLTAETRITGVAAGDRVESALAVNATAPTALQLLTLAPGVATGNGGSSYALRAFASPGLVIERVTATAGAGRAAMAGAPGADGRSAQAGAGGLPGLCDGAGDYVPPGGAGGTSPVGRSGGRGGDGGVPGLFPARPGAPGLVAQAGGGPGGLAGASGNPGHAGGAGVNGQSGSRGLDGQGGASGTGSGGSWASTSGENATNGSDGHGGGGGGGGGGQTGAFVDDGYGGGGGGGGGGGEGGRGGRGGTGGGGSFGIFLVDSTGAVITDSVIGASDGAAGGAGGRGGQPGQGGARGLGGTYCTGEIGAGGNGGLGGVGGLGAHGGGGAGGPSIALYRINSTITASGNTLTFGTGGAGGSSLGHDGTRGAAGPTN